MRATLKTAKASTIPEKLGICADDTARIAAAVNDAQERLIYAGRDAGWWQTWRRTRFSVSRTQPYITLPREFARIINMAVGTQPIYIHNEFYEVLPGGIGPRPDSACPAWCGTVAGYERGVWPTSVDLTATHQRLRVYLTDLRDADARLLVRGQDQYGNELNSQDGLHAIRGFHLTLVSPFAESQFEVSVIHSIVKPMTFGDVLLYQVDQVTGEEVLLSRYLASETQPAYRRYYLHPLPATPGASFTVTAVAKLEFIPAVRDTDPLIIGNLPALTEMCQALRYYSMDVGTAHQLGMAHEKRAYKLLRQELDHYMGVEQPAVSVDRLQGASFKRLGFATNI